MALAIVFGIITLFLFVFGLMKLRMVWLNGRHGSPDFGQLILTCVILVLCVVSGWQVWSHLQ